MSSEYVSEADLDIAEIRGELASGTLTEWRVSADGTRWFKRVPQIHGVPRPTAGQPIELAGIGEIGDDMAIDGVEFDDGLDADELPIRTPQQMLDDARHRLYLRRLFGTQPIDDTTDDLIDE